MRRIRNADLTLEEIPAAGAGTHTIKRFASTFDGYKHCGSFAECAEVANSARQDTLTDLRTCLFFEWRRWHHFGESPDEEAEICWRGLVEKIRGRVKAGDLK
jgi:hypothetical protein